MDQEMTATWPGASVPPLANLTAVEDERLVAAARADPEAFVALYHRYVTPVYRYLHGHVGNRPDAEDLTAVVFGKVLAGLDSYAGRGSVAAWLFSIARHTLRDHQRRRRPTVDVDPLIPVLVDADPSPEAQIIGAEQARQLHGLIQALPDEQREALTLHFFAGLRATEIAAIQGGSQGAIRMRIHRALVTLRQRYQQEDRP